VWGMQLPWSWGLTAAVVVVPLAWFNLGCLLVLQEAAVAEQRQRREQAKALRAGKRFRHKTVNGGGDRGPVEGTTTGEQGGEG